MKKVVERLCEGGTTEAISLKGTNLYVMDCFTSLAMATFLVSPKENFMFRLTEREEEAMVSQNAIPSRKQLGGYLPFVLLNMEC